MSAYESIRVRGAPRGLRVGATRRAYESFEVNEATTRVLEMELAQELLEITNEAELEEFLGELVRRVARGASTFMRSGVGKAVGGVLRNVAKTALPMVGSALGSLVAPGSAPRSAASSARWPSKPARGRGARVDGRGGGGARGRAPLRALGGRDRAQRHACAARRPPRLVARSAAVASARRYAPGAAPAPYGRPARWRGRGAPASGEPGPPGLGVPYAGHGRAARAARLRAGWAGTPASGTTAAPAGRSAATGRRLRRRGAAGVVRGGRRAAMEARVVEHTRSHGERGRTRGAAAGTAAGNRIVLVGA